MVCEHLYSLLDSPWRDRQLSSLPSYYRATYFMCVCVYLCSCLLGWLHKCVLSRCSPPPYHFHTRFCSCSSHPFPVIFTRSFLRACSPADVMLRVKYFTCGLNLWSGACLSWPGDGLEQVVLWRQHDLQPQTNVLQGGQEILIRKVFPSALPRHTNVWIFLCFTA